MVLAPVVLACLWWGGAAWFCLIAVAAVGLSGEWSGLCGHRGVGLPGGLMAATILAACGLAWAGLPGWGMAALVVGAGATWAMTGRWSIGAGIPYLGIGCVALLWLRFGGAGWGNVLFVMLIVWASDIGAYAAGRFIGGRRLAPSVSPGKTWSGAAGGLLSAILIGEAVAFAATSSSIGRPALVACVLGLASQAGDLFESWLKRRFGVKDSGALIPGHGGLLDRLDGLLAAAPVAAGIGLSVGYGAYLWQ